MKKCVDQLREIYLKFSDTHQIIIGGDLNENLTSSSHNRRANYMLDFMKDCQLSTSSVGATFIHPNGKELFGN